MNPTQKQWTIPKRPVYLLTYKLFNDAFNSSYSVTPSNRIICVLLNIPKYADKKGVPEVKRKKWALWNSMLGRRYESGPTE